MWQTHHCFIIVDKYEWLNEYPAVTLWWQRMLV